MAGDRDICILKTPRLALGPTQPPTPIPNNGYQKFFLSVAKRTGRAADY